MQERETSPPTKNSGGEISTTEEQRRAVRTEYSNKVRALYADDRVVDFVHKRNDTQPFPDFTKCKESKLNDLYVTREMLEDDKIHKRTRGEAKTRCSVALVASELFDKG